MSKIFVSLASYCDALLKNTIQNAYDNACFPDRLVFGVVEQAPSSSITELPEHIQKQIKYVLLDPVQSRGVCWARSIVQSLYADEDWFLQVDAHTLFDPHWDVQLIASWMDCLKQARKPFMSSFLHSFEVVNGEFKKNKYDTDIIANTVMRDVTFGKTLADLAFNAVFTESPVPVRGFHAAAGFIFAPGSFVYEIPYDPHMYFYGEEHSLSLRAFTHGWDIFHPRKLPLYHYYYNPDMEIKRPHHWGDYDAKRSDKWWELDERAKLRFEKLVSGASLGVYGLGDSRTVEDYAKFSGIDYINRAIDPKAYVGPWHKE